MAIGAGRSEIVATVPGAVVGLAVRAIICARISTKDMSCDTVVPHPNCLDLKSDESRTGDREMHQLGRTLVTIAGRHFSAA